MPFEPIRIGNTVVQKKAKATTKATTNAKTNTYEIKNEASPHLMKSIGDKAASFEATDVLTMRGYLQRAQHATELYVALRLLHDLGRQLQAMMSFGHSIACVGIDDVIVITHRDSDAFMHNSVNDIDSTLGDSRMDPQFLFLNDHLIFELDNDGFMIVDHAIKSNDRTFMSPELQLLVATATPFAPFSVHFKTIYYSTAQLIIYFLLNVDRIPDDEEYLNPIKFTKLYWFLRRCLNPVPAKRSYVYI